MRVRLPVGVSTSPMVKERFVVASSFNVMLGSAEIVGSSLTGVTVTVNWRLNAGLGAPPSLTVTVMVAVPLLLALGVKRSVPVAPDV